MVLDIPINTITQPFIVKITIRLSIEDYFLSSVST